MRKIVDANTATRNQDIETLIDKGMNMFPESGNMFLKKELIQRGYKILSSVIFEGGFNIDFKSPKGDLISLRITHILSNEVRYRIWDQKYNLISDYIIQYLA